MDVKCTCGYVGYEVVQYESTTPCKQVIDFSYGYSRVMKTLDMGTNTLNWACPKCGKVLVQQRGGLSYGGQELEAMEKRLRNSSWAIERLHKCEGCGKPINAKCEYIKGGTSKNSTKYYHEDCIKVTANEK